MFYTVYILYSLKDKKLYTGCTKDLQERIRRHSNGRVNSTKHRRPLVIIHSETFSDKGQAFKREKFLKSLWGVREKRKILKLYLDRAKPL